MTIKNECLIYKCLNAGLGQAFEREAGKKIQGKNLPTIRKPPALD